MTSVITTAKRRQQNEKSNVLGYSPIGASRSTVRRQYARWCKDNGLPVRCDVEGCIFHTEPLEWLSQPLPLILDHINGNKLDNRPPNLRYLCPNCDSQLSTRGGKNRGRVLEAEDGTYVLAGPNNSQDRFIIATPGNAVASGHVATVRLTPEDLSSDAQPIIPPDAAQ
jgi:hypothetical protein